MQKTQSKSVLKNSISHRWINTQIIAPSGITKYFDIIRFYSGILPAIILRNQFDTSAGIYIVTRESDLNDFSKAIRLPITVIEKYANKKANPHKRGEYQSKKINEFIESCRTDFNENNYGINPEEIKRIKRIAKEYIESVPSLKILKSFKCLAI